MNNNASSPVILDGSKLAKDIRSSLVQRINKLQEKGIVPCLATVLVGDNPASETYVRMKGNACKRIGMTSVRIQLPHETTTEELMQTIHQLNQDPSVHGILLQHPVPDQIDERAAFDSIALEKDVDGVTSLGFGRTAFQLNGFAPCTPQAIMTLLDEYEISLTGKNAVVIGRSPILGKPAALMLMNRDATVTVCHSKTQDLQVVVRQADIVVAAVGRPEFVKGDWLKPGAIVLDAGYNKGNIGDVHYESCLSRAGAITPVPGGVGPVTIATLLKHTVEAAEASSCSCS